MATLQTPSLENSNLLNAFKAALNELKIVAPSIVREQGAIQKPQISLVAPPIFTSTPIPSIGALTSATIRHIYIPAPELSVSYGNGNLLLSLQPSDLASINSSLLLNFIRNNPKLLMNIERSQEGLTVTMAGQSSVNFSGLCDLYIHSLDNALLQFVDFRLILDINNKFRLLENSSDKTFVKQQTLKNLVRSNTSRDELNQATSEQRQFTTIEYTDALLKTSKALPAVLTEANALEFMRAFLGYAEVDDLPVWDRGMYFPDPDGGTGTSLSDAIFAARIQVLDSSSRIIDIDKIVSPVLNYSLTYEQGKNIIVRIQYLYRRTLTLDEGKHLQIAYGLDASNPTRFVEILQSGWSEQPIYTGDTMVPDKPGCFFVAFASNGTALVSWRAKATDVVNYEVNGEIQTDTFKVFLKDFSSDSLDISITAIDANRNRSEPLTATLDFFQKLALTAPIKISDPYQKKTTIHTTSLSKLAMSLYPLAPSTGANQSFTIKARVHDFEAGNEVLESSVVVKPTPIQLNALPPLITQNVLEGGGVFAEQRGVSPSSSPSDNNPLKSPLKRIPRV